MISMLKIAIKTVLAIASLITLSSLIYHFSGFADGETTYCHYSDIIPTRLSCGDAITGFLVNTFNPILVFKTIIFFIYVFSEGVEKHDISINEFYSKDFLSLVTMQLIDIACCLSGLIGSWVVFKSVKNLQKGRKI